MGCGCRRARWSLPAVGERVFAAESIIKRRIRKGELLSPGRTPAPQPRPGVCGPAKEVVRQPGLSPTPAPSPPRVPASSPPPLSPFFLSGRIEYPGEMEGVGHHGVSRDPRARGKGSSGHRGLFFTLGGAHICSLACASASLVLFFILCMCNSAGTALGSPKRTS